MSGRRATAVCVYLMLCEQLLRAVAGTARLRESESEEPGLPLAAPLSVSSTANGDQPAHSLQIMKSHITYDMKHAIGDYHTRLLASTPELPSAVAQRFNRMTRDFDSNPNQSQNRNHRSLQTCPQGCKTCQTNAVTLAIECLTCNSGYYKSGYTCPSCSSSCVTCSGPATSCTLCNSGFFLQFGNCLACQTPCTACTSTVDCLACVSPRILITNHRRCKPPETNCLPGTYLDLNSMTCSSCKTAMSYCSECASPSTFYCSECKANYFKDRSTTAGSCTWQASCGSVNYLSHYGACLATADSQKMYSRFASRLVLTVRVEWLASTPTGHEMPCPANCANCDSSLSAGSCRSCMIGFARVMQTEGTVCGINSFYSGNIDQATGVVQTTASSYCWFSRPGNPNLCVSCLRSAKLLPDGSCLPQCLPRQAYNLASQTCDENNQYCSQRSPQQVCLACVAGAYLNTTSKACIKCAEPCATCDPLTPTKCLTCSPGYQMVSTGTCKLQCPTGSYFDAESWTCLAADPACKTADNSPSKCTSCPSGFVLSATFNCSQRVCELGHFFHADSGLCQSCDSSCLACAGSSTACTACRSDAFLDATQNACLSFTQCDSMCKECSGLGPGSCRDAVEGYYLDFNNLPVSFHEHCQSSHYIATDGSCRPCHGSCLQCVSESDCTLCSNGYFRWNGRCISNSVTCDIYNGHDKDICTYCKNGWHPSSSGSCVSCPPNTLYCSQYVQSSGVSLSCAAGYTFGYSGNCTRFCDPGKVWSNEMTCSACHASCRTCINMTTSCDSCAAGDILVTTPGPACQQVMNVSFGAYVLVGAAAQRCTYPCDLCSAVPTNCTRCMPGYLLPHVPAVTWDTT